MQDNKYRVVKKWDKVYGNLYIPQYKPFPFIWVDIAYHCQSPAAAERIVEKHKMYKS